MAAGADVGFGLVIGDVGVALHARCAVGADLLPMDVVAGGALTVTFTLRIVRNAMKARQHVDLVAARACCLCGYRAPMRLVTTHALPMSLGALGHLVFMAASARGHPDSSCVVPS